MPALPLLPCNLFQRPPQIIRTAYRLHHACGVRRAFGPMLRRSRFGPFLTGLRGFTPTLRCEGSRRVGTGFPAAFRPRVARPTDPPDRSSLPLRQAQGTMPSADFCRTIGRPPEVSSATFGARPPDLQHAALDGCGLCGLLPARPVTPASYPILVHRAASLPSLLSDPASRRRPCESLALRLHPPGRGTCTPKLPNMLGTQHKAPGRSRPGASSCSPALSRRLVSA